MLSIDGTVLIKSKSIIGHRHEQQYKLLKIKHITAFPFDKYLYINFLNSYYLSH